MTPKQWTNLRARARRLSKKAKVAHNGVAFGAIRRWSWLVEHGSRSDRAYENLKLACDLVASLSRRGAL